MVRARPGLGRKIKYFLQDEKGSELESGLEASMGSLNSIPLDDEMLWQRFIKKCQTKVRDGRIIECLAGGGNCIPV